ncbi:hypothetical protein TcCL_NonESM10072 [Trypanosoma cruzi]|nr:hypothetical protein TcCL_NonESM10072 [Trypanosoma cruzi]
MRHPCTVVVVVTVILFFPDGSETGFVFHLYDVLTPTVGAESVERNDGKLAATVSRKNWRSVCCASGGDGCSSLLLLVYGGCSVVMCVFLVWIPFRSACSVRVVPAAGGRIITAHATATPGRCVCLFAAPLCISLLPFFSPLCAQICSPTTATLLLLLLLLARVRENDDDCVVHVETELLCGSEDSGVHRRPVGESSRTACRTGKKPDSRDLTEEEAFNAIFGDFAARSCSDYDGTNNSGGMEEYKNPDLTTPNTTDAYGRWDSIHGPRAPAPAAKEPTNSSACSSATQSTSPLKKRI